MRRAATEFVSFEGTAATEPGWWEALWPSPHAVIAALHPGPIGTAVDLCCGDGWFTQAMARAAHWVTAIDIDESAIDLARTRFAEHGLMNATFVKADACDVADHVTAGADFLLLANVLHGAPDKAGLLRAIWLALRPGGVLAIVNWHARPRERTRVLGQPRGPAAQLRMGPQETLALAERSGFAIRNFAEVSPHHYGVVFERLGQ